MTTKNQAKLNVLTSIAAIDGLGLFRAELRNTELKTKSLVVSQSINNGLFREVITINSTDKIAFVPFEGKDHPVREGYEMVFTVNKEIIDFFTIDFSLFFGKGFGLLYGVKPMAG